MNVEIGTESPIFLFWEYLFQNFGILSLQCDRLPLSGASSAVWKTAVVVWQIATVLRLTGMLLMVVRQTAALSLVVISAGQWFW
jgi:hypothetical protein